MKLGSFLSAAVRLTVAFTASLPEAAEVFRLTADGPHDVEFALGERQVKIKGRITVAGIYVLSPAQGLRQRLQARHAELLRFERSFDFDPAGRDPDFDLLQRLLP